MATNQEIAQAIADKWNQKNPGATWTADNLPRSLILSIEKGWVQLPSAPNQGSSKQDTAPSNRKTPQADLGAQQRIATAGETVPIVFGKRVSNKGGVWVQPSLVRAGSDFFKGSFLFPVSQGQIVSSPVKHRVWIGLRNLRFITGQTITISHIYNSAATLASSPSTCPILGGGLYCGNSTYSFVRSFSASGSNTTRLDFVGTSFFGTRDRARGTGDTSNTAIITTAEVFDNVTGNDITAAYFAALGLPTTTEFAFGVIDPTNAALGCYQVGTVYDFINGSGIGLGYVNASTFWNAISSGSVSFVDTIDRVETQYFPGNPASTGTLDAIQTEYVVSQYANPNSTPTADNSAFADITFLKVVGDIYDPPESGSYPTTTRQLSVFYEQGVRVELYSAGGGSQGASNQFVDLAMYLFEIYKRVDAAYPDVAAPVLTDNLEDIATFCDEYNLHFNGVLSETVNIVDFISETSPYFLLSFLSDGGQYRFAPLLPLNGSQEIDAAALTPTATFTESEILPGSFSKSYKPAADKTDVNAVVLYRLNDPTAIGTQQTVQVRYDGVALDAPAEQFDMTDFCANRDHAILYAKHYLARRRYSLHQISFATPLSTDGLIPTDIIKVQRQRISSSGDNRTETEWYQITAISHQTDGTTSIQAAQFPVDSSDIAVISDEVLNGTFKIV